MTNYFDTYEKKDCNGCGTCALRCPKHAITMQEDEEGFYYPIIDKEKCINCGLCKKICSNNPSKNEFNIKVYAAKNKNENQRKESTSGGIFRVISEYVISKKGIVFGAKYDKNMAVIHDYANTVDGCKEFSISKYVRSNLNNSYQKVEQFLKEGRLVLFTGTPCQNYGLKIYLKKDYSNLITCEIICHSNPSPKVFELYKKNIEKKYSNKIINYKFRNKSNELNKEPYAELSDGRKILTKTYNSAFNNMLISRPSCSNCKFCDINRKSDLTIGDYWGIDKSIPYFNDGKGISLLTLNNEKGLELFDKIKAKLEYKESNLEDAFRYNHHKNVKMHKNRNKFFKGISNGKINETNIIKYMKKYNNYNMNRIKRKIKSLIKIGNK